MLTWKRLAVILRLTLTFDPFNNRAHMESLQISAQAMLIICVHYTTASGRVLTLADGYKERLEVIDCLESLITLCKLCTSLVKPYIACR